MRKIALFVSALLMVFAFSSCSKTSPSDVANDYYSALKKGDFEKALSYTNMTNSEEIQQSVKKMQGVGLNVSDYEIVKEEIAEDGNSATVEVKYTFTSAFNENPEEKTEKLNLVKEDKKWVISAE